MSNESNRKKPFTSWRTGIPAALFFSFLTACGGGGGGDAPAVPDSSASAAVVPVDSSGGAATSGATSTGSARISAGPGYGVDVDMNSLGTAVAVWEDTEFDPGRIWSNRFENGSWGTPVQLWSSYSGTNARVAVNGKGEAVAVWERLNQVPTAGLERSIWAVHYRGGTWSVPTQISAQHVDGDGLSAFSPVVGLDDAGNALVGWIQDEQSLPARNAWTARYNGTTWNAPTQLSDGIHNAHEITLAMNSTGDAVVAWRQDTYTYAEYKAAGGYAVPNMWAARYSAGAWSAPSLIGDASLAGYDGCANVQVAMNTSGDTVAVCEQHKGNEYSIAANTYKPGPSAQWLPAPLTVASTSTGVMAHPSVDVSDGGDILVGWEQGSDISWSEETAQVRRFVSASATWDDTRQLSIASSWVEAPRVSVDSAGNGYAVWYEKGVEWGTSGWKISRFNPSTGWGGKQSLPFGDSKSLDLVAAGNGYATLAFHTIDYTSLYFPEYVSAITWP